jgi:hypothetical protein
MRMAWRQGGEGVSEGWRYTDGVSVCGGKIEREDGEVGSSTVCERGKRYGPQQ